MRGRRHIGLAAAALLIAGGQVGTAHAAAGRATLPGSVPAWASSSDYVGAAAAGDRVGFRVYLGWRDADQLQALAQAVSTPGNPSYGSFLTPAQFRARFAPTADQVSTVRRWLQTQGFSIDYVPANNHYVVAEGTVAQASSAFGVQLGLYRYAGKVLRSPAQALTVPSSIAPYVSGVLGLDDSAALVHTDIAKDPAATPPAAFVNAPPCSTYWGEKQAVGFTNPYGAGTLPYAPCGYTPQQVKGAYGFGSVTEDGSGQTVAVIDAYASPTVEQDVNQWSTNRGLPALAAGQLTQAVAPGTFRRPQAPAQDPQGWAGEETLDIEAVHGMAPGAHIVYVGAPNNYQDLDAALNHVVDNRLARIVTNSYGFSTESLPPGYVLPYEQTILQGVAEGIGIYFSSGDSSDESLTVGYRTTDWPASSPFVTAVGGTTLAVGASDNYLFETGWGTTNSSWKTSTSTWSPTPPGTWLYGAGGGVSRLFAEPSYQQGVVPSSVFSAQGRTGRAVPDIGALADPNAGYLIGLTQRFPDGTDRYGEYRIGGTSLASPIVAGLMALADQAAGSPHGFANPLFYQHAGAFTDVVDPASTVAVVRVNFNNSVDATDGVSYKLRTANQTLSLHTTPGYDDVTGLGTPTAALLGF